MGSIATQRPGRSMLTHDHDHRGWLNIKSSQFNSLITSVELFTQIPSCLHNRSKRKGCLGQLRGVAYEYLRSSFARNLFTASSQRCSGHQLKTQIHAIPNHRHYQFPIPVYHSGTPSPRNSCLATERPSSCLSMLMSLLWVVGLPGLVQLGI